MMKFLKKADGGSATAARDEKGAGSEGSDGDAVLPRSFLSLNVNGLKNRVEQPGGSWLKGIGELVARLDPDVIAMQEVKLTAKAPLGAKRGDGKPRQRDQPWDNDKQDDWKRIQRDMLGKEPWLNYTRYFSCADWRYAGTLTLFKKGLRKPEKVYFNFDLEEGKHDENGRVCVAQYSSGLRVANLYAPNNGWNEQSNFKSRRSWDDKLTNFVRRCHEEQRELIVVGDLNVAHQDADVSPGHQQWFREQTGVSSSKPWTQKHAGERIASDDVGQPGFTRNEQKRFSRVLEEGRLIDTFRVLHPADRPVDIADAHWTWRGSEHQTDKYYSKAMRIDYCLVSESLRTRIKDASILGQGFKREGCFGSDHVPIFLELSAETDCSDKLSAKINNSEGGSSLNELEGGSSLAELEPGSSLAELEGGSSLAERDGGSSLAEVSGVNDILKDAGPAMKEAEEEELTEQTGGMRTAPSAKLANVEAAGGRGQDKGESEARIDLTLDDEYDFDGASAGGGDAGGQNKGDKLGAGRDMRRHNAAVFYSAPVVGCGDLAASVSAGGGHGAATSISARHSSLPEVEHDQDNSRFVVRMRETRGAGSGGDEGGSQDAGCGDDEALLTYVMRKRKGAKVMDMDHTFTPESMRGRGIAEHVTLAAFQYCEREGYRVIPTCTYISDTFLSRHPELRPLVTE